ncbi:MAG: hypothetical protein SFT81_04305 [Candidatus Caenarcaniphilales bacterium]|nr:hypothetical protein [Candidatus Caenarcaniphilales bacterium]
MNFKSGITISSANFRITLPMVEEGYEGMHMLRNFCLIALVGVISFTESDPSWAFGLGCPKRRAARIQAFKDGFSNLFHNDNNNEEAEFLASSDATLKEEKPPRPVNRTPQSQYSNQELTTTARINGGKSYTSSKDQIVAVQSHTQNATLIQPMVKDYTRQPIPVSSNPYHTN